MRSIWYTKYVILIVYDILNISNSKNDHLLRFPTVRSSGDKIHEITLNGSKDS